MQTQILKNENLASHCVGSGYYKLTLNCPSLAKDAKPGQFVMLQVNEGYDPLLRRPFSIHRVDEEQVQILYQVVGRGTQLMAQMQPGQMLDVLGPLGNGFWLPRGIRQAMFIGGGVGVAPLLFWAQELARQSVELLVFVGGKGRADLLAVDDFRQLGAQLYLATEDGSQGETGRVTSMVGDYLAQGLFGPGTAMFACGPKAMLAQVASLAQRYKLPCQLSLDVVMACGVGACGGCVVKTREVKGEAFDYSRVCRQGPVFEASEIVWEQA